MIERDFLEFTWMKLQLVLQSYSLNGYRAKDNIKTRIQSVNTSRTLSSLERWDGNPVRSLAGCCYGDGLYFRFWLNHNMDFPGFPTLDPIAVIQSLLHIRDKQMEHKHSLWASRPRRRQINNLVKVFEDDTAQRDATSEAQFLPQTLKTQNAARKCTTTLIDPIRQEALRRKPRRSSVFVQNSARNSEEQTETIEFGGRKEQHVSEVQKPPRRRTIYIPSEETSIFTIHPGAPSHKPPCGASPTQNTVLFALPEDCKDQSAPPPQSMPSQKRSLRTSLATAPRRAPLQCARNSVQSKAAPVDVPGKRTGKENIPPYQPKLFEDVIKIPEEKDAVAPKTVDDSKRDCRVSIATKPRRVSIAPRALGSEGLRKHSSSRTILENPRVREDKNNGPIVQASGRVLDKSINEEKGVVNILPIHSSGVSRRLPSQIRQSSIVSIKREVSSTAQLYPILSEGLERPELYEDHWLNHQETAIAQLINGIFDSCQRDEVPGTHGVGAMRKRFLRLYADPSIALLHKRLQASLLYGALSISKEAISRAARTRDDVGLRRKFLNVWLNTYDIHVLKAAAEAVIGREAPALSGSSPSPGKLVDRRRIEEFLELFLLRNRDASESDPVFALGEDDFGSLTWSWRRTVTRSLLLVHLMDRGKCTGAFSECLFKKTSAYKSSEAVLKAIANLILPSLGDVTRPLVHLDFQLQHVQHPLQEFKYRITNMAVELRDGLILTHLVELLLYPSGDLPVQSDGTVTLTLPGGELLTTTALPNSDLEQSWFLSQLLKYPCIGRAQKLYNSQIAISALGSINGMPEQVLQDIKAEHLVDGHREKTLRLLWILVGRWGLEALMDWNEMQKELYQLRTKWQHAHPDAEEDWDSDSDGDFSDTNTSQRHQAILKAWAASVGRLHGISIRNLSTSFSDGQAFEAIVNEYWHFSPNHDSAIRESRSSTATERSQALSIHAKLRLLGCSNAFVDLIPKASSSSSSSSSSSTAHSRILTSGTVIPTLAFLASRLLPLARSHRAASAIQRAYRRRLARRDVCRRLALVRLAHHCAHIVQTREKVERAAVVLQRGWREVLARRIQRLQSDVRDVQALIRGWRTRRKMRLPGKVRQRRWVGVGW